MKVNFLIFCDQANFDENNKLNINGIFDQIQANGFPALRERMSIVAQLDLPAGDFTEFLKVKKSNWEIRTSDITFNKTSPGQHNIIHNIENMLLLEPGYYEVEIFVNGNKVENSG